MAPGASVRGFIQLLGVVILLWSAITAMAADPDPLLDFCMADPRLPCKSAANVTGADFIYEGLALPGNPNDEPSGVANSFAFVTQFPALHTLGIAMARVSYAEGGLVNLHTHPRSSEILYVVEGTVYVGFVTSDNKFYDGVLEAGHASVVPRGLVHFSLNVGKGPASAIAIFNSENPGAQFIPQTLFGSSNIGDAVLAKGFGITEKTVKSLKSQFRAKFGN